MMSSLEMQLDKLLYHSIKIFADATRKAVISID